MIGLAQLLGLTQQAGGAGGGAGLLSQEIAANPAEMQGFMGQADLQPQVGAQQASAGPMAAAGSLLENPEFLGQLGQMMGGGGGEQQQPPMAAPLPQARQTMLMPNQGQAAGGAAPQWQGLLGRMF